MKIRRFIFLMIALWMVSSVMTARQKIGLVLGGGGAKGAAEVGVLKVLEEAGVKPDYIVGTSIGSIVGGLYAAGYTATELETMFKTQEWLSLLTDRNAGLSNEPYITKNGITYIFGFPIIDNKSKIGVGMIKGERIEHVLDSMLAAKGVKKIEKMKIPFCCVAADIHSAEEVVLSKGSVASAMRASMAIPGIFKPVKKGDCLLVDGGMQNNLPVDVAREMGAEYVIAIDLTQNKHETRSFSLKESWGIGGILDWLVSRPDWKKYNENVADANLYINPPLDYDALDFQTEKIRKMIDIGYQTAKQMLAE